VRFDGNRVWITGASSGIGEALAHELAGRGARVAISARRADRLEGVAAGTGMVPVTVDVSDRDSVLEAERTVRGELGGIDMAVLNAGTYQQMDVTAWDTAAYRRHVDVNLMGLVHGVEAVLPAMRRARSGRIVGVASVAGYRGFPSSEAYGSTKAAQINLLESLRAGVDGLPGVRAHGPDRGEHVPHAMAARGRRRRPQDRRRAGEGQGRDRVPAADDAGHEGGARDPRGAVGGDHVAPGEDAAPAAEVAGRGPV
jgi:NADP-dependent 3-hydroxy acid dehydrogenase YdfG